MTEKVEAIESKTLLNKSQTKAFARFLILIAAATLLPFLKHQLVVGSAVNATLFLGAALLGPQAAIMVGLIPSLVSISTGLLPPILAPMIPFIMVSNSILIIIFSQLKRKNHWLAVVSASLLKFLFLYSSSTIVINLLLKKDIAKQVALMMSYPQLITALIGGVIASVILFGMKKANQRR